MMIERKNSSYTFEAENITVKYNRLHALSDFSFKIKPGEIVGILGDNGAGKTSFVHALLGLSKNTTGNFFFAGHKINVMTPEKAMKMGIEVVFQDSRLFEELNIVENIFMGREIDKPPSFLRIQDEKLMEKQVQESLHQFGITDERMFSVPIKYLPGGIQQIIAFMRAYLFCSSLFILDEPIKGLDEKSIEIVLRLIRQISNRGVAVIFITHKAHEVFNVADRFVILKNGRKYQELHRNDTNLKDLERFLVYSRLNLVKELTASVSHQLRNPISIIRLFTEMLKENFTVSSDQEQYNDVIGMIINEADKMDQVISNLIEYSHEPEINKEERKISPVIEDVLSRFKMNSKKEIVYSIQEGLDVISYNFDEHIIRQILENILSNADDATKEDEKIYVSLESINEKIQIKIRDEGIGIPKSELTRIYNPYFTKKVSGTGIGLTIVERMINEHGGTISIDSEENVGTTVFLRI